MELYVHLLYTFVARCLIKHGRNFNFTLAQENPHLPRTGRSSKTISVIERRPAVFLECIGFCKQVVRCSKVQLCLCLNDKS